MTTYVGAEYSLIQFVPSPEREEAVNIGVAVSFPDDGALRWLIHRPAMTSAAKRFIPDKGSARRKLDFQVRALEASLRRIVEAGGRTDRGDSVRTLAGRLSNEVRLTDLHPTRVSDSPEAATQRLFEQLVLRPTPAKRAERVDHAFRRLLHEWDVADYVEPPANREICIFGGRREVRFHGGYQNGCMNYIRAERLDSATGEDFVATAALMQHAGKALGEVDAKLVVFLAAEPDVAAELTDAVAEYARVVTQAEPDALRREIVAARDEHAPRTQAVDGSAAT